MNLLNRKLKDKLKALDDIDKQYIINIKKNKNHTTKNYEQNNNINSIDIIKRTVNEKFDKIYSDFILNENSYYNPEGGKNKKNYSMNKTNFDKDPTNEDSIAKDNNNDSDLDNIEHFQYQNNSEMEVGQRLYNYGIFLKNKLENQRLMEENRIKLLMKPRISTRSKSNIRNPEKISERLFQNYKKNIINKNKNKSNISNNDTNFSFHPKINKKSLLIANNLEPSFIRLNKKKKIKNNSQFNNKGIKDMKHDIFSFNYKNNNNSKKDKKNNNKNIFEKMNNLYLKGVEERQKKEKIYNEKQKIKDDEYKQFTFKPHINKNIYTFKKDDNKNKKNNSKKEVNSIYNIYKKQFEWKKKIDNKNIKKKEKKDEAIYKQCTFKPEISKHNYKNNEKNISKVLAEMNEYVEKRRKNIKYKKIEEKYKNRRLGGGGSEYIMKTTIPQEFELETDTRNKNLNKNKNRSCDNFHINKNNLLIEQNSSKKSINNENEKNYWFYKEEMNNSKNNNTKVSNKNNEAVSQMDFFEAVNILHDKLEKLNI